MSEPARRVWITGASSGIGAALALELAARGHTVAITARRADRLAAVAAAANGISAFPGDVTDHAAMVRVAQQITEQLGGIDIAVLNAGTYTPVRLEDFSPAVVDAHLDVNVRGVVNCLDACLPLMRAAGSGHIALMASVTALIGFPLAAAYGSTKAYVANMGESLRPDLAHAGIRTTIIYPGFVQSELTDRNPFPMPGIISADRAATIIADGLGARRPEIWVPGRVGWMVRRLARLPGPLRRRWLARIATRRRSDPR